MSDEPSMTAEQWHAVADLRSTEIVRLEGELDHIKRALRLMYENNLFLQKHVDILDEFLNESDCEDTPAVVNEWAEKLSEKLQALAGDPPKLPYPEAVHASFSWRDPKRADGYYDALPGDGFGFLGATSSKLTLQFDCAGALACADIPFEQLGEVLATRGLFIVDAAQRQQVGAVDQAQGFEAQAKVALEKAEELVKHFQDGHAALVEENEELQHRLDVCEKLTELIATVEDRRVLEAVAKLPISALVFMSSWVGAGASLRPDGQKALDRLVSFELARRIQAADLDLPLYMNEREIIETTHEKLFAMLEQATEEGEKAKAMTPDEREDRYEAFIREKGWLKEGETLDRRPRRFEAFIRAGILRESDVRDGLLPQQGVTNDNLPVRDVQAHGGTEPKPD